MATSPAQLVVIGGGPGGYAAAFYAADLGLDVVLVDEEPNPGGVCLYRGCIPSKALLHAADVVNEARHAASWGIEFGEPRIDIDRLRAWKDRVVGRMTGGLGQLVKHRRIRYLRGRAAFDGASAVAVDLHDGGTESIPFEHAIVATGSRPAAVPGLPVDGHQVVDSTGALDLPDVPGSLLVVGGGYIGLELGTVYAALGSQVTVVEMMPGLLPGADRDLVDVLARTIGGRLHEVLLSTRVVGMTSEDQRVRVALQREGGAREERTFAKVLVAVGRRPNSQIDGLDRTAVEIDERGFLRVDAQRRTAEPSIFAIGDVAGEPMLAHKASHEARVAVDVIAGHKAVFDPAAIPAVVFTDPELAWCGLTEADAETEGVPVEIARFPWAASGRATTLDRSDGLTKLVLEPGTARVLGVGIVGPGAGELIAEGVLAVEMAATATDLKLSIHPHPTLSETVMESAEVYFGQSSHLYRPRTR